MESETELERIEKFEDLTERTRCTLAVQKQRHRHLVEWFVLVVVFSCGVGGLVYLAITKDERPITFMLGLLLGQKLRKRPNEPPG